MKPNEDVYKELTKEEKEFLKKSLSEIKEVERVLSYQLTLEEWVESKFGNGTKIEEWMRDYYILNIVEY